ncbi:uncharacterized protein V2V93DRAFT_321463 [Kockiozyma suomiensis]|uniref:uncharacterized protein n=1 Tax=Kockiozyma suomiensis TaxID=1337062 RepID=UPI003343C0E3
MSSIKDVLANQSFFSPYTEQLKTTLEAFRKRITEVEAEAKKYKSLSETLEAYPRFLSKEVNVKVSPRAIVKAQVVHTNEIYTSIGDGYVIQQSAYNAARMAERKAKSMY